MYVCTSYVEILAFLAFCDEADDIAMQLLCFPFPPASVERSAGSITDHAPIPASARHIDKTSMPLGRRYRFRSPMTR